MVLSGKNVVYFGGCGGIGAETCKQLVLNNVANLAVLDLNENTDLIEELTKQSTKVTFLKVDIRCNDSIKKCLQEVVSAMGHIDILVNGIGLFNEMNADLVITVNLLGLINSSMAAMELMGQPKGNRGGLIVNIASSAGLDPIPSSPIYAASKGGVIHFTRSLAEDFENTGVSCITICPGVTDTQLLDQFRSEEKSSRGKYFKQALSVMKYQTPAELAVNIIQIMQINKNGAVYLCDRAKYNEVSFLKYWDSRWE